MGMESSALPVRWHTLPTRSARVSACRIGGEAACQRVPRRKSTRVRPIGVAVTTTVLRNEVPSSSSSQVITTGRAAVDWLKSSPASAATVPLLNTSTSRTTWTIVRLTV